MKIVIIEDEIRASQQLETMVLQQLPDAQISKILEGVEDSVQWLQRNQAPDLIFMDIQLADGLSFEIFQKVQIASPVIFTTAYDQYSIRAFKVNSIDYLLKPIQQEDLIQALSKYKKLHVDQYKNQINSSLIEQLLKNTTQNNSRKRFLVKEGNSMILVPIEEVLYFYSSDGLSFLVTKENRRFIVDSTLDALESEIDETTFFRINRSQIVHINSIEKIHSFLNHRLKLDVLKSSAIDFVVSRNKVNSFKDWVNQ